MGEIMQKLAVVPMPSIRMQRHLRTRFDVMMRWYSIARRSGKGSYDYETWRRQVDRFLDDIDGTIYLMGYNPLDHTAAGRRKPEKIA